MGVFATLFRRDSPPRPSSSSNRPPLSTLDIPLPRPRPAAWGPRTPASLPQTRTRFGPRDPYNVYDPPNPHDPPPPDRAPSRRHGPDDHLSLDGHFTALHLSNGPPPTARQPSVYPPPPEHARPPFARASTSAPASYPPPPARPLAPQPVAPRPPAAPSSLATPLPVYSAFPPAPPTLPLRPTLGPPAQASARSSPRPSPAPAPSSSCRAPHPTRAKASTSRGRPAPAPVLPRSASAPSSSSDGTYRAPSSSSLASSSSASDDSLPHPSRLGTAAHSPQPRTPGSARRSSPAAGTLTPSKGASSPRKRVSAAAAATAPQQQCAALTARSTRCTRLVRPTAGSGLEPEHAAEGGGTVEDNVPAYCAQHARGKLVESGYWIPEDLPDETKALLRHYMALAVSHRDCPGFLYVHELVPKGSSPSLDNGEPALIKLGRSLRPIARLSQWRASCPSSEPIVRLFAPALPSVGAPVGEPPPSGTRNHHRWERLCLVELAGRAAAAATAATARTPCGDCGRTHVECFLLPRASVTERGWDEIGWSVNETVERWARWCDDLG
ncbi:hypothetical protein JCM8208_007022 [Rhodotorula glutinis]